MTPLTLPQGNFHGRIIVDASSFFQLSERIHQRNQSLTFSYTNKAEQTYLRTLTFLADHGYQILIPEMISIEVKGPFANGTEFSISTPYHEQGDCKFYLDFLKDAAKPSDDPTKQHPNILIVPDMGTDPKIAEYLKRLKELAELPSKKFAQKTITNLFLSDRKGFGDTAIKTLVSRLLGQGTPANTLLLLSDDQLLRKEVKEIINVPSKQTNRTHEFLGGLKEAGLFDALSLNNDLPYVQFHENRRQTSANNLAIPRMSQKNSDDLMLKQRQSPFFASLNALATELASERTRKEAESEAAAPAATAEAGEGVRKFLARYERFKRGGSQNTGRSI